MEQNNGLDGIYTITDEQINAYTTNGFIKLKDVLTPKLLLFYKKEISRVVNAQNPDLTPMELRDTYGKAFIQTHNLWQKDAKVKDFVLSKRLGRIAAELMQVDSVRLYHDQALFKETGGGLTPWHADQFYWPLDTNKTTTIWIPLQETTLDMGPLEFSTGSQSLVAGRELGISDESESFLEKELNSNGFEHVIEPFDLGEVSFHSGWTFHRAGANQSKKNRHVMTMIYMDANTRLKQPANENEELDRKMWCPGTEVGEVVNSPLNPVVF